jgi:hypothetical protein
MTEIIAEQWQAALAGAGIYGVLREAIGLGLRLYAAKLRSDGDKTNDAMADVLDDAAKKVEPK